MPITWVNCDQVLYWFQWTHCLGNEPETPIKNIEPVVEEETEVITMSYMQGSCFL